MSDNTETSIPKFQRDQLQIEGETEIAKLIKEKGADDIRFPDILFQCGRQWFIVEVKNTDPFRPPPDWYQAMGLSQYRKDLELNATGLTAILVVRGRSRRWLAQYINALRMMKDPRPVVVLTNKLAWFRLDQFEPADQFFQKLMSKREWGIKFC